MIDLLAIETRMNDYSEYADRGDLSDLFDEVKRLREHILRRGWWQEAPCVLCGYEGEGYYQPETHECARLAAALAEEKS